MTNNYFCGLTGEVITPSDKRYNMARRERNSAIQKFPLAIVFCHSDIDVSNAIIWSKNRHVPFRIRNGRHNYEGYSTGNDVLVIDISRLNRLFIDETNGTLIVEAGVNNEEFYEFISSRGYPFPGGSCPSVGISGYILGGGWGYSARYLGLGCDSLIEAEMIDYRGVKIKANSMINSDLFWALKGAGGGNFGVVVSMKFKLPQRVSRVTFIQLSYPYTSREKQAKFLSVWQDWLENLDDRMTLGARIFNSKEEGRAIFSRGIFYGRPDEAKQLIKPLIDIGGVDINLQYISFLDTMEQIENSYPPYEKFKSISGFANQRYSRCEINGFIDLIEERAEGSSYAGISLYAMGGKIREKFSFDTAFFYRNAKYIMWLVTIWEDDLYKYDNIRWINDRAPYVCIETSGSYVNFPYSGFCDYLRRYYGENKYKLIKIKYKYDPYDVFKFPQSIK